jgi:hypothetical protein
VTLLHLFSNCIILSVLAVALAGTTKMAMSLFQVRSYTTLGSMINYCLVCVVLFQRVENDCLKLPSHMCQCDEVVHCVVVRSFLL